MGWQSWIVGYNTDEEYDNIISILQLHNRFAVTPEPENPETTPEWEEVGEELERVVKTSFRKNYKIGALKNKQKAILFGNGGGRGYTHDFLERKGLSIVEYRKGYDKYRGMIYNVHACSCVIGNVQRKIRPT